jgi:signal transduction histidine kinase
VREAVADIDEEVLRLNRVVTDVLDFAKPLRFDLAPTDVNEVCGVSAAAATAERADPAIGLALDPALPAIVTDGERLRAALVNLLANARHAIDARRAQATAPPPDTVGPPVELTTAAAPDGGVLIVVRDHGIGIEAADLPRVFEPYFTTRRAGTGLGLAITRNIIEGLGGTIAIASQRGVGTEIRIELPGRAAGSEDRPS